MPPSGVSQIRFIFSKKRIDTKKEYYLLYEEGLLGNKALTWKSYDEILKSGWKGPICIRSSSGTVRKNVRYNVPLEKAEEEISKMSRDGIKKQDMAFNQSMPDKNLLIQGELSLTEHGLYILYTLVKKPMNLALKEQSFHSWGLKARLLLESHLWPSSLSDIYSLFELFPDSVIEFSAYRFPVGDIPGRNTIIWEVRNY